MTIVERMFPGFQWADPLEKGQEFEVEQRGGELQITALWPSYASEDRPSDLIRQYEKAPKEGPVGKKRTGKESPDMLFANAETDEKLIAFVRRFGPVVAKDAHFSFERPEPDLLEPPAQIRIYAAQNLEELRNEQLIYRAAVALVRQLNEPEFDYVRAQSFIGEIAAKIGGWPRQWGREALLRKREPLWKPKTESLQRIKDLSSQRPDILLPKTLDGRIVICELLNCFPGTVFPNPLEMHSSIRYGIRPLLYALIRRQFLSPRDGAACANARCRNFFNIERTGQKFCSSECSLQQRQRNYWAKSGKKLRRKRLGKRKKSKM